MSYYSSDSDSEAEGEYWDRICREREEVKRLEEEQVKILEEQVREEEINNLNPNHQLLIKFYNIILPIIQENKDKLFYSNSLEIKGNMFTSLGNAAEQLYPSSNPVLEAARRSFFLDNLIMNEDIIEKISKKIDKHTFKTLIDTFKGKGKKGLDTEFTGIINDMDDLVGKTGDIKEHNFSSCDQKMVKYITSQFHKGVPEDLTKHIKVEMCKVLIIIYYSIKYSELKTNQGFEIYKHKFDIIQTKYFNKILEFMSIPHSIMVGAKVSDSDFFNMANCLSFNRLELLQKFMKDLLIQLAIEFTSNGDLLLNTLANNNANTVAIKTKILPRIYFNKMYAFMDGYYTIVSRLIDTKLVSGNTASAYIQEARALRVEYSEQYQVYLNYKKKKVKRTLKKMLFKHKALKLEALEAKKQIDTLTDLINTNISEIDFLKEGECPGYWFDEFKLKEQKFPPPPTPTGTPERQLSDPPAYVPKIEPQLTITEGALTLGEPQLGRCVRLNESDISSSSAASSNIASSSVIDSSAVVPVFTARIFSGSFSDIDSNFSDESNTQEHGGIQFTTELIDELNKLEHESIEPEAFMEEILFENTNGEVDLFTNLGSWI